MSMKRILLMVCLLAIALAAAARGGERKMVVKLGHIRDTNHPTHVAALRFKELIESKPELAIEVRVYPNSQLGNPQDMFVQMQTGDLEMVYGGINTMAWIKGGEAFEITAIPFLFRDYDHMRRALRADFFKPIIEAAEKATGIKIVNIAGDTAPRGLSTRNTPVNAAADFAGLKIRTAASPSVLRAMQILGAHPQQVPLSDLYMALRTGVVDAQENGAIVVATQSLYEVQNYYMKTDYIRDIETFYMPKELWDGLSDARKQAILEATETTGAYETELTQKELDAAYAVLREKLTVIDPDLDSIRAKLDGAFDDYEGSKWPKGLLKSVAELK